jgi:hypothetical protein
MKAETYRISIDGDWTLEDWYVFPRTLSQVYAFLYSMTAVSESKEEPDEDDHLYITYTAHPWRGGYSAVNFYNYLQNLVPGPLRPRVVSAQFSSPGWFELGLAVAVALSIKRIVKAFCDAGREINSLYNEIYNGLQERKLLSISVKRKELQLEREVVEFIDLSMKCLARMMGFEGVRELYKVTPNPLAAVKILLSFYRRVGTLAEYQQKGKAEF